MIDPAARRLALARETVHDLRIAWFSSVRLGASRHEPATAPNSAPVYNRGKYCEICAPQAMRLQSHRCAKHPIEAKP